MSFSVFEQMSNESQTKKKNIWKGHVVKNISHLPVHQYDFSKIPESHHVSGISSEDKDMAY